MPLHLSHFYTQYGLDEIQHLRTDLEYSFECLFVLECLFLSYSVCFPGHLEAGPGSGI